MKIWLEIIKKRRVELNYTQADMADALGVDQGQYSKLEKGRSDMTLKQFELAIMKLRLNALLFVPYP